MANRPTDRPFIEIEKTNRMKDKEGNEIAVKAPTRVYLDTCWGTVDHILRLATKPGNRVLGYGNLVMKDARGIESVADEFLKIQAFCKAVLAGADPKLAATDLAKAIEVAVESATAPLLAKLAEYEKKFGKKSPTKEAE